MTKVKILFADSICPNFILFELLPIVSYNFLYLFMNSLDMVGATLQPLLLTIIFQFKNSVRNDVVHQLRIGRSHRLWIALSPNVEMQCQEKNIFVKFQLVFHILNLRKYLENYKSKSSQIFPHLCLLDLKGKVIVLFEDEGGRLRVQALCHRYNPLRK